MTLRISKNSYVNFLYIMSIPSPPNQLNNLLILTLILYGEVDIAI